MKSTRKFGPIRIRPHIRDGVETGQFCIDIPAGLTGSGKRIRKFFDTVKQATEMARALARELENRSLGLSPIASTGMTFSEAVEGWREDEDRRVATRKKRPVSLRTDGFRLKSAEAFFGDRDLASIDERQLMDFQAHRLNKLGRSAPTVNSDIKSVFKVLKWAHKNGKLRALPTVEPVPVELHAERIPSEHEVRLIIEACSKRLRILVWFIAETGCRAGEAFNLLWSVVDLDAGKVRFGSRSDWTPKTQSSIRTIDISPELSNALQRIERRTPYLFASCRGTGAITNIRQAFASAISKVAKAIGDPTLLSVTPHTLRKAWATRHALSGVPEPVVQAILGHAKGSTVTARYYVKVDVETMRVATKPLQIDGTKVPAKAA